MILQSTESIVLSEYLYHVCLYQLRKVSSHVFVLGVSILTLFLQFFNWILELFGQCGIFCFILYYHVIFHKGNCIKIPIGITYLKCQYASRRDIKTRLTRPVTSVEQELPTLPEHLSSPSVFSGVRVSHLFSFRYCIFWFVCLRSVSSAQYC